jgi:hypothetical protein
MRRELLIKLAASEAAKSFDDASAGSDETSATLYSQDESIDQDMPFNPKILR